MSAQIQSDTLEMIWRAADRHRKGSIGINEAGKLFSLCYGKGKKKLSKKQVQVLFLIFDLNGDGVISKQDFFQVALRGN